MPGQTNDKLVGPEKVAEAVLKDPVVQAAIEHVGEEPVPSRIAAQKAEQSETSLRTEGQRVETSLRSEGQRNISMIWEVTQQRIALMTVGGGMMLAGVIVVGGQWLGLTNDVRIAAFMFVAGAANLVIGFYYGRTNHQRVGGPGGDEAGTR